VHLLVWIINQKITYFFT
jgi:hypothetical protein